MGCIYNGVCSSLVALFLQQVKHIAAVIGQCGISPNREFIKIGFVSNSLWVCVI